jgi:hypothetical protein
MIDGKDVSLDEAAFRGSKSVVVSALTKNIGTGNLRPGQFAAYKNIPTSFNQIETLTERSSYGFVLKDMLTYEGSQKEDICQMNMAQDAQFTISCQKTKSYVEVYGNSKQPTREYSNGYHANHPPSYR